MYTFLHSSGQNRDTKKISISISWILHQIWYLAEYHISVISQCVWNKLLPFLGLRAIMKFQCDVSMNKLWTRCFKLKRFPELSTRMHIFIIIYWVILSIETFTCVAESQKWSDSFFKKQEMRVSPNCRASQVCRLGFYRTLILKHQ